jgi:lipoprotein-anchoring transpeptidase ErfK/SrfK
LFTESAQPAPTSRIPGLDKLMDLARTQRVWCAEAQFERSGEKVLAKFVTASCGYERRVLRGALTAGVALAALVGFSIPADAQRGYGYPYGYGYGYGWRDGWYAPRFYGPSRRVRSTPTRSDMLDSRKARRETIESQKDPGFGDLPKGPLQIVVSIDRQKVTLFSNGVPVAQGPVSTGVPSHPTPTGVFSVIEKDRYHRSNLYSNAPMPFMQRITWSGVALHEGVLPGYPASHGCIRMSHDFARKLWPVTKLGVRVVVAHADLAPADFAHPKLFVPKLKPPEPPVAMIPATDGQGPPPFALAQATQPNAESDAPAAAPEQTTPGGNDLTKPEPAVDPMKPVAPRLKAADQPVKRAGQVAVFVSRKENRLFVRQGFIPLFDMPVVIDEPDRPLGTHVFTAMAVTDDGAGMRWNLITFPTDGSLPPEDRPSRRKANEPPRPAVQFKPLKPPSTAAQALNRIHIPQDAIDRIGELLIAGSSLLVSDEGLGKETGRYTEFIVLGR